MPRGAIACHASHTTLSPVAEGSQCECICGPRVWTRAKHPARIGHSSNSRCHRSGGSTGGSELVCVATRSAMLGKVIEGATNNTSVAHSA
eukprot:4317122-Prymnesium_polylepis.1